MKRPAAAMKTVQRMKRPAAVMKKPAAIMKKPSAVMIEIPDMPEPPDFGDTMMGEYAAA